MNITLSKEKLQEVERRLTDLKAAKRNNLQSALLRTCVALKHVFGCEIRITIAHTPPDSYNCQVLCLPVSFKNPDETNGELIYYMSIILGDRLLYALNERELVAVFLHEYGHWYLNYKTALPHLKTLMSTGQKFGVIAGAAMLPPILWPSVLLFAFINSTITSAISHKIEYGCDEVAVKYGYGKDLHSAFKYLDDLEVKFKKRRPKISAFFSSLKEYLFGTSHPSFDDRMSHILTLLKDDVPDVLDKNTSNQVIKKISSQL